MAGTAAATHLEGRQAYQEAVRQLIALAQQQIAIYSGHLPADDYAEPQLVAALRDWVVSNQRARVRILLHEPKLAVSRPNRLIGLGLQLSSYFSFRDTPARHMAAGDMLIIDRQHLLQRPQADSRSANLWLHDPLKAQDALKRYDALWEESLPSQEVRMHRL